MANTYDSDVVPAEEPEEAVAESKPVKRATATKEG